jgi:hypothetical protein
MLHDLLKVRQIGPGWHQKRPVWAWDEVIRLMRLRGGKREKVTRDEERIEACAFTRRRYS